MRHWAAHAGEIDRQEPQSPQDISVHISVHVTTTDAHCGPPHLAAHGLAVVVTLDEHGNARPVRQWQPVSNEDQRLDEHARHLIELRQFIEPFTTAAAVPADAGL